METLNTLLASDSDVCNDDASLYNYSSEMTFSKYETTPLSSRAPCDKDASPYSNDTESGSDQLDLPQPRPLHRTRSNYQFEINMGERVEGGGDYSQGRGHPERIPVHDRRTILITNLADRTTHKDIAGVIRGGRLLDIFLRNDRSATVSFVEGAANFLAYTKRNDVYIHAKRVRTTNIATHVYKADLP